LGSVAMGKNRKNLGFSGGGTELTVKSGMRKRNAVGRFRPSLGAPQEGVRSKLPDGRGVRRKNPKSKPNPIMNT